MVAFIPLANFYFPGNIRAFAKMLMIPNTAGQGAPNLFYTVIDKEKLDAKPYTQRFDVMGINTTIFIDNCGSQITIFLVVLVLIQIMKFVNILVKKWNVKNKFILWIVKQLNGFL